MLRKLAKAVFGDPNERELKRHREVVERINALEPHMERLSDEALRAKTDEFRRRLREGETLDDLLPEAFAVVREAAKRTIGQRHYDVQLIGGIVLHQGKIAEMKTGEGKTLVATLPLYLNALSGHGAHLVTPNDYLSKIGLQLMGPIYHFLGLTSAVIQSRGGNETMHSFRFNPEWPSDDARYQNLEPISRQEAYQADITYGTNNEFGFDYLRDNMVHRLEDMVQRGHHYAIVDEVDNILIDEARTPLIISGQADEPSDYYGLFAQLVRKLRPSSEESVEAEEPDGDYVEDVQTRSVYLTERGVAKIEELLAKRGLLRPSEDDPDAPPSLYSRENSEMLPYLDNALRAHVVYQRDRDYVVMGGQVIIVDEFTGRLMHGRRFSEGLHQAIEAKEGVEVRRENLTLATITFQNYFRMYEKLAGMTGTAATESSEFEEIYDLEVTVIPTHKPMIRVDYEDMVFMTERAKWKAVVREIKRRQQCGQPILVGTAAIETSERLSGYLKRAGIEHAVLNAKQHEREAVIIAQAGRPGTVTIATNMAGRGVDILLGGNPEGLARDKLRQRYDVDITEAKPEQWEEVLNEARAECARDREVVLRAGKIYTLAQQILFERYDLPVILADDAQWQEAYEEAKRRFEQDPNLHLQVEGGGLYVLGTERHEARRIDNQLRGRSGRQGDPGESRFYLSLEDDLMRRFGGERVRNFMKRMDMPEELPIQHRMISKSIQQAQTRVEAHNFDIRKRVLEYDDVVNKQRETIYAQRRKVLEAAPGELRGQILELVAEQIENVVAEHMQGDPIEWDFKELRRAVLAVYPVPNHLTPEKLAEIAAADRVDPMAAVASALFEGAGEVYRQRVEKFGEAWMAMAERYVLLNTMDQFWQRHLTDLDVLREGIGLVGIGGRDPLVEYQRQSYEMWRLLQEEIKTKVVQDIFRVAPPEKQRPTFRLERQLTNVHAGRGAMPTVQAAAQAQAAGGNGRSQPRRGKGRPATVENIPGLPLHISQYDGVGRNDPCPCGSGKKFKHCCYKIIQRNRQTASPEMVRRGGGRRRRR